MNDRSDRPITSITTVSDVRKIDMHEVTGKESMDRLDSNTQTKCEVKVSNSNAPTTTAIRTTIPTGKQFTQLNQYVICLSGYSIVVVR